MNSADTSFQLSVFEKLDGPLSKTITLDGDGHLTSDACDCFMASGVAQNTTVLGLNGLAELIGEMASANALALGTILDRVDDDVVQVTTKNRLSGAEGYIARTKDFLVFPFEKPGLLLIDFDQKGMPDEIKDRIAAAGGVWELICEVIPGLKTAGYLRRKSTSASLHNVVTGEAFEGSGGEHIYVAVQDAADILRATKTLHQRLWLVGLGWIRLGKVGQMLERSIVDQSVGSPERLVFEGAPILEPPLEQSAEARKPIAVEGEVVDTKVAVPDLTPQERTRFAALLQMRKHELKPKADLRRNQEDEL